VGMTDERAVRRIFQGTVEQYQRESTRTLRIQSSSRNRNNGCAKFRRNSGIRSSKLAMRSRGGWRVLSTGAGRSGGSESDRAALQVDREFLHRVGGVYRGLGTLYVEDPRFARTMTSIAPAWPIS